MSPTDIALLLLCILSAVQSYLHKNVHQALDRYSRWLQEDKKACPGCAAHRENNALREVEVTFLRDALVEARKLQAEQYKLLAEIADRGANARLNPRKAEEKKPAPEPTPFDSMPRL